MYILVRVLFLGPTLSPPPPQYNIYIIVFTRDYTNWSPGRDPGTAAPPPPVAATETYLPIHQHKNLSLEVYLPTPDHNKNLTF